MLSFFKHSLFYTIIGRFFSLQSIPLILIAALALPTGLNASQTYILSYRAEIKNAVLISENFNLSEAMTTVNASKAQSLKIELNDEENFKLIMEKNRDSILEFLMRQGVHTRSHERVKDAKSSSLLTLTIPPTYITVDFNDDYAILTRLILN